MRFLAATAVFLPLASALTVPVEVDASSINEARNVAPRPYYTTYCAVNGYQKKQPLKIIPRTCDLAKCANTCKNNYGCKSYSISKAKNECRLYAAPAVSGQLTPNPNSPFKHYDKSCKIDKPKPTSTTTKTMTSSTTKTAASSSTTTKTTASLSTTTKTTASSSAASSTSSTTTSSTTTSSSIASSSTTGSTTASTTPSTTASSTSTTGSTIASTTPSTTASSSTTESTTASTTPSVTTTTASTTTSAAPTPTTCDQLASANEDQYTSSNGKKFDLECGFGYGLTPLTGVQASSYKDCVDICSTTDGCAGISFIADVGFCNLASEILYGGPNPGVDGARLVPKAAPSTTASSSTTESTAASTTTTTVSTTPSTTASSSTTESTTASTTTTTASTTTSAASTPTTCAQLVSADEDPYTTNGKDFDLDCGGTYSRSDISGAPADSYQACVDRCSITDGCVGALYFRALSNLCVLASSIGTTTVADPDVDGARLIVQAPPGPAAGSCAALQAATPADNDYAVNNAYFVLECGRRIAGNGVEANADTFQACLEACSASGTCYGANFRRQDQNCLLLSSVGTAPQADGYDSAYLD